MISSIGLRKNRSFTIVELLLVSVVLLIILGLSVPNFSPLYAQVRTKQSLSDLIGMMRYAQARAVVQGRTHQLIFENDFSEFRLQQEAEAARTQEPSFAPLAGRWGKTFKVSDGVEVSCPLATVHFYPDGNIEKTEIEVASAQKTWVISTMLQKGAVHLFEEE